MHNVQESEMLSIAAEHARMMIGPTREAYLARRFDRFFKFLCAAGLAPMFLIVPISAASTARCAAGGHADGFMTTKLDRPLINI